MREAVSIPILNIVDCTISKLKATGTDKVGVICSQETNNLLLYKKQLDESGIFSIFPDSNQQKELNSVILNVMGGKQGKKDLYVISRIFDEYNKLTGVKNIILGCTELPLAITQRDTNFTLLSTLEILSEAAIDYAYS